MPDILKITTPLINKVDPQNTKIPDGAAFDLQEIQKVIKTNPQAELLKQNNGMLQKEEAPVLLMNLLKDPSVTVGFLKNIFMLQEIIQLLPVNNSTVTKEIEQMFDALLVAPEEIVSEMQKQEDSSTVFKGELFNFLREVINEAPADTDRKTAVASLLKAVNNYVGNKDVLDALANTLQFLGRSLSPSKSLSDALLDLSGQFRRANAGENFEVLKNQVLSLLGEVEESILYTEKTQKMVSITVYNLSRYNSNPDFIQESVINLTALLSRQQREQFHRVLASFFAPRREDAEEKETGIMDVLAKIIGRESQEDSINLLNSDKIEKIIHSLLSSPCNFTPLLHYVIPVLYDNTKAFAEIWINPNGQEDEKKENNGERNLHILTVFDLEGIGRFEAELFIRDKEIDFSLFCPPAYATTFESLLSGKLSQSIAGLPYHFGNINITKLEKNRSLMDVFKFLPYKRTGVNVKI